MPISHCQIGYNLERIHLHESFHVIRYLLSGFLSRWDRKLLTETTCKGWRYLVFSAPEILAPQVCLPSYGHSPLIHVQGNYQISESNIRSIPVARSTTSKNPTWGRSRNVGSCGAARRRCWCSAALSNHSSQSDICVHALTWQLAAEANIGAFEANWPLTPGTRGTKKVIGWARIDPQDPYLLENHLRRLSERWVDCKSPAPWAGEISFMVYQFEGPEPKLSA